MRRYIFQGEKMRFQAVAALAVGLLACQDKGSQEIVLTDQKAKISYAIGLSIGNNFKQESIEVDHTVLMRGIQDAMSGAKALLTDEECNQVMMQFQQENANRRADKNMKDGQSFLAENKTKEGVFTLPSGLQYKVIKAGTGKTPTATDTVTTHYRGTLIDGTEFDSSYKRGKPASFPVNRVIAGWTEALQLMQVGAKWQLFIPSELAYGSHGAPGGRIGPNATLIFDIELLGIE
jgi:FKBP-type peptidyl-prolyl cis-trans isomerase